MFASAQDSQYQYFSYFSVTSILPSYFSVTSLLLPVFCIETPFQKYLSCITKWLLFLCTGWPCLWRAERDWVLTSSHSECWCKAGMWWEGTLHRLAQHGCSEQQGPVSVGVRLACGGRVPYTGWPSMAAVNSRDLWPACGGRVPYTGWPSMAAVNSRDLCLWPACGGRVPYTGWPSMAAVNSRDLCLLV